MWRALEPDTLMRAGRVLTAGWSLPRVFSLMDSASLRRLAASLYLFWSLKSRKHFQSIYCYSLCNKGLLLRSSWEKAVSMTTGWWHNKPNVPNGLQIGYYHSLTKAIEDKVLRPFFEALVDNIMWFKILEVNQVIFHKTNIDSAY